MGISAANFESAGQFTEHYIPGVYSRRNTIGAGSGVSSGNLVILGTSMGGKPFTLHCVTDKTEAKDLLVKGELLDGVVHAFNGSNTYVPQQVYCMRVNNGTQSSRELKNNDNTILKVFSKDYGVHTNQIKMFLDDGTTGKNVEVVFKGNSFNIDNIEKKSFSIFYLGEGVSATCSITDEGITLKAIGADVREIDIVSATWEECETVADLVAKINDSGSYSAILIDTDAEALSCELDHVANVELSNQSATVFKSDLKALIEALKSIQCIGDVELVGKSRVLPDNDLGFNYFTGATNGTSTIDDWSNALELLEKEDVQIIATPATDVDIHTLISDHCTTMSTVSKKKERTFWVGMPSSTSIEKGVLEAKSLNSELGSLVITGAKATDPLTGQNVDISPALLACKCAGMEAAMSVSTPLTNKVMKVNSFSTKYKDSELNTLIKNGIVPFGTNDNGELVCIRSMTTYQGDNLIKNERSMTRSVLFMDRDLRKAFGGKIGNVETRSASAILEILQTKAKEWLRSNLITLSDDNKIVFNEKVKFDGDKTYLTFERYIRAPNNFIFITGTNKVYSSTVEV